MTWNEDYEIEALQPIIQQMRVDLTPLAGKRILNLCSADGRLVMRLCSAPGGGYLEKSALPAQVIGLELDATLLFKAGAAAWVEGLGEIVSFQKAEMERIPLPDNSFDALVSDFIVYSTPMPTQIGQREMARVLKPGGLMILTDVILTQPIPQETRQALGKVGLNYLCEATPDDFRTWMAQAGLVNVHVQDITPLIRKLWEMKSVRDLSPEHRQGYAWLLEQGLGKEVFYIYVRGRK